MSLNSALTVFLGKALDTRGPHCYRFILRGEIFKVTASLGVCPPFLRENWFLIHSLFLDDKSGKIKTLCEDHLSMWLFREEETHSIIQWRWACMLKYQAALSKPVYLLVNCYQAALSYQCSAEACCSLVSLSYHFSVCPLVWKSLCWYCRTQ